MLLCAKCLLDAGQVHKDNVVMIARALRDSDQWSEARALLLEIGRVVAKDDETFLAPPTPTAPAMPPLADTLRTRRHKISLTLEPKWLCSCSLGSRCA